MNTRHLYVALFALVATYGGAAAQQDPQQRIAAALDRARAGGLPVELLESKIAEGRAKGVAMDRIAFAVEQRATAMTRAAEVLAGALPGQAVAREDIAVGADALQAGVQEAALAHIAGTAGHERRTVAIAALAQLVAAGAVPAEALQRVKDAMARGDQALMNLPGMAGQAGGPPAGIPPAGRPAGTGRPPGAGPPGGSGGPPGGGS
ncbi:MAG: hypothetical protein KY466_05335 [Gemmatimonadetes bacterium]|nr:hypothetical protein [Gemmatimonadota bacterium]